MSVRGYKVFNPDWTCRGFQYKVGEAFEDKSLPNFDKDIFKEITGVTV